MNRYKNLVFAALCTALIIAGTFVRIPVGPVPIVLATVFVLIAGLILDFGWALASVGTYLALGAIGLPVFTGGGGVSYFAGPTGGYLIGYFLAAVVVNLLSTPDRRRHGTDAAAVIAGTVVIYLAGVPWLKYALELSWSQTLSSGLFPFLPGDALKAALAFATVTMLKRRYPELLPRRS